MPGDPKKQLDLPCWRAAGPAGGGFFPQQPERLGVLPRKLRGALGQPPETLHQVPRGSEGMEPVPKSRFHS